MGGVARFEGGATASLAVPDKAMIPDDTPRNLSSAAKGMTTVWVCTHYSWSGDEAEDPDHVHHKTEDVTVWRELVVVACEALPPLDSRAPLPHKRARIVMDRNTERSPS